MSTRPEIDYGMLTNQPIHLNLQYLMYKAGIGNGEHKAKQFVAAITDISLEDITKTECRHD